MKIVDSGELFDVVVVSYNKENKTGGKVKKYVSVCTKPRHGEVKVSKKKRKDPEHKSNATRNLYQYIQNLPTSTIRKIHIFLIIEVNGQKVML